jgi:gas vesicle protein
MAYSDVLRAMQQYGSFYNYGNFESVNPYSSEAYGTNISGILSENPEPINIVEETERLGSNLSDVDKFLLGVGQAQVGSTIGKSLKIGKETHGKLSDFLGAGSSIPKGTMSVFNPTTGQGMSLAPGSTVPAGFEVQSVASGAKGFDLALPLALYSGTRDQNPYEYSDLEFAGSIASGASLGASVGGPPGAIVGAVLGLGLGLFEEDKADKKRKKQIKKYEKALDERQQNISEAILDLRSKNESMKEAYAWAEESSKYQNQYGGNIGIMKDGGKMQNPYDPKSYNNGGFLGGFFSGIGQGVVQLGEGLAKVLDDIYSGITGYDDSYYKDRGVVDEEGNKKGTVNPDGSVSFDTGSKGTTDVLGRIISKEGSGVQLISPGGIKSEPIEPVLPTYNSKDVSNRVKETGRIKTGPLLDPFFKQSKNYDSVGTEDYRWDLDSPLIRENVEVFQKGGQLKNIVAEFTGNELVVNDQNEVEAGLASGDFKRAAAPIRKAMGGKMITPGQETHKSNPMPVDNTGTIYSKKGVLPFKVKKGAGIYDHATDQFKSNMDDKEIAMVAKKNINKWKKNNMA